MLVPQMAWVFVAPESFPGESAKFDSGRKEKSRGKSRLQSQMLSKQRPRSTYSGLDRVWAHLKWLKSLSQGSL